MTVSNDRIFAADPGLFVVGSIKSLNRTTHQDVLKAKQALNL